jgi:hypothetical protein
MTVKTEKETKQNVVKWSQIRRRINLTHIKLQAFFQIPETFDFSLTIKVS